MVSKGQKFSTINLVYLVSFVENNNGGAFVSSFYVDFRIIFEFIYGLTFGLGRLFLGVKSESEMSLPWYWASDSTLKTGMELRCRL